MDFRSFVSIAAILVLLTTHPYTVASGRSTFGLATSQVNTIPETGICSAAPIMNGYRCQEFNVVTGDGYILSLLRFGSGGGKTNKQPVLLQHGIIVDGMTWLLSSPDQSLAYLLADNGYDVWIANTRGTRFSRRHVSLDPSNPEFWNWTWDDLVTHELPAVVGFIFNQTRQKVHYVGHSLGTLVPLASFSEGNLVDKLKSATLLSPIAYLSHMTTALLRIAAKAFVGEIVSFNLAEFNPAAEPVAIFVRALCATPGVGCSNILTALTGDNCCLNSSTIDVLVKSELQPTATKNLVHLAQTVRDGMLTKYNYGNPKLNLDHYGQITPPLYNLANIPRNFPLLLSYGGQDALSDVMDVENLLGTLKQSHDADKLDIQYIKEYAHMDFIIGDNAKEIVYNQIMDFFKRNQ